MVKKSIVIGEKEKHTITAETSEWTGTSKIIIDDKQEWSGDVMSLRSFDYTVGDLEKHTVHITIGGLKHDIVFNIDMTPDEISNLVSKRKREMYIALIIIFLIVFFFGFFFAWMLLSH